MSCQQSGQEIGRNHLIEEWIKQQRESKEQADFIQATENMFFDKLFSLISHPEAMTLIPDYIQQLENLELQIQPKNLYDLYLPRWRKLFQKFLQDQKFIDAENDSESLIIEIDDPQQDSEGNNIFVDQIKSQDQSQDNSLIIDLDDIESLQQNQQDRIKGQGPQLKVELNELMSRCAASKDFLGIQFQQASEKQENQQQIAQQIQISPQPKSKQKAYKFILSTQSRQQPQLNPPQQLQSLYRCSLCNDFYNSQSQATIHIRDFHKDLLPKYISLIKPNWQRIVLFPLCKPVEQMTGYKGKFFCKSCGRIYHDRKQARAHVQKYHNTTNEDKEIYSNLYWINRNTLISLTVDDAYVLEKLDR